MIKIDNKIAIPEQELQFQATRASGPGGQNVNRVKTAVQLRFSVDGSPSLPDDVRHRLRQMAGNAINNQGELVIDARRFRTQERNRDDAIERFATLLRRAAKKPRKRVKTKPGKAAKERRLRIKHQRGETKKSRTSPRIRNSE